jgi:hypothetical protein
MERSGWLAVIAGSVAAVWAPLTACGLPLDGDGPEPDATADTAEDTADAADGGGVESSNDGANDVSLGDAGAEAEASLCNSNNCGGACCGDTCIVRSCAGCGSGHLLCPFSPGVPGSNGYCLGDCSQCGDGGAPQASVCWSCGAGSPSGTCTSDPATCAANADSGACQCPSGDAGECPGSTQVCVGLACLTCGQQSTDMKLCANGKGCMEPSGKCGP